VREILSGAVLLFLSCAGSNQAPVIQVPETRRPKINLSFVGTYRPSAQMIGGRSLCLQKDGTYQEWLGTCTTSPVRSNGTWSVEGDRLTLRPSRNRPAGGNSLQLLGVVGAGGRLSLVDAALIDTFGFQGVVAADGLEQEDVSDYWSHLSGASQR